MDSLIVVSNVLLWIAVLILAALLFALTRQVGILYERVAPAGALMVNQTLQVGTKAPEIEAVTLNGDKLTIGQPPKSNLSQLLFFLAPDCPICKSLLPVLKSVANAEKQWISIVLASDGDTQAVHNDYVNANQLNHFPYVISELLGKSYGVSKLPYAVLIDEAGQIASLGIVNSREHLESLFEAKERQIASIQEYLSHEQNLYTDATQRDTR